MTLYTGNTVEEAIERGLKRENIARENAHIEIEQKESRGFLGVGRKRARVNIEPIEEETVRRADRMATRHVEGNLGLPEAESAMEATLRLNKVVKAVREMGLQNDDSLTEEEKQEKIEALKVQSKAGTLSAPADLTDTEQMIADALTPYLVDVVGHMGIEATVVVKKVSGLLTLNLSSKKDALLIGKHGKILASLDNLAKAYTNRLTKERLRVAVNVGDYHEKRVKYLTSLAQRASSRARQGETVYINDLPANERKIVHNVIAGEEGVSSHSEGQDRRRYIVVTKNL